MQLYFARHAESVNNQLEGHSSYYVRRTAEPELTARGREQAEMLAKLLAWPGEDSEVPPHHIIPRNPWNHEGFHITHLYTSLQRRAVETADRVARALDIDAAGWSDLHECGGVMDFNPNTERFEGTAGANAADLAGWSTRLLPDPDADPSGWWAGRPVESRAQSAERADRVYRRLLDDHGGTDDRVLLISHSMFYVFFLCRVLGIEFRSELWFTLNNAGLTRIDIGDGDDFEPGVDAGWRKLPGLPVRISYLNRLDHLPVELLS